MGAVPDYTEEDLILMKSVRQEALKEVLELVKKAKKTSRHFVWLEQKINEMLECKEKSKNKCSFINCDNPASICFSCHGEECVNRFEEWKRKFLEDTKNEVKGFVDGTVVTGRKRWGRSYDFDIIQNKHVGDENGMDKK